MRGAGFEDGVKISRRRLYITSRETLEIEDWRTFDRQGAIQCGETKMLLQPFDHAFQIVDGMAQGETGFLKLCASGSPCVEGISDL